MKERTVLIIDDNVYKKIDIQRALALLGVSEVDWSRSLENAKEKIRLRGENPYSLIITDMNYPLTEGDKAFYRSGERLVGWVAEEGLKIPVILCSSVRYTIPGTAACIWYSELRDLAADLKSALASL